MSSSKKSIGYTHIPVTGTTNKAFHCNRLTFINKGTIDVTIGDNFILSPGQSITYPAWPGEVNDTIYSITFPRKVNGGLLIAVCKNEN